MNATVRRRTERTIRACVAWCVLESLTSPACAASSNAGSSAPVVIVGDAIPAMLTTMPGDPARGRTIVADRHVGLCLLCHAGPFADEPSQGTLAPDLSGTGTRWNAAQLRLRIVDARTLNPESIMPAYYRVGHDRRVGPAWQGRPILDAQQIEDVVAFLATLR